MSEGIALPRVARGTLLDEAARLSRLDEATPQILAAVDGETDAVAVQATLACLLWDTFAQANWCGFYRRTGEALLTVGPYHGGMGCLRITFDRGVCGACARTRTTQLVPDVHAFPGHIACDDATRSELVVPVLAGDRVMAVLDLDSPLPSGFGEGEARRLEALVAKAFGPDVRW
jgi:GAF domain-containing protein